MDNNDYSLWNKDLRGFEGEELEDDPSLMLVTVNGIFCYRFIEYEEWFPTRFYKSIPVSYDDEIIAWDGETTYESGKCMITIIKDGWNGVL